MDVHLEVRGLTKRFGGLKAVDNLSFDVYRGEILGIIGPNGAGKTTTFNLITGHLKPDSGKIVFEGKNITGLKPYRIARMGILRTFQIVKYFPNVTVQDHILVGAISKYGILADRSELNKRVEEVLEFLGLSKFKDVEVRNLTTPLKKLVELATALVMKPKVLLLDELMAGLNPTEIEHMMDLLRIINKDMKVTLVIVEHIMRAVMRLCERIIVLHYGKKIAEGAPEEVSSNPEVIRAYLGEEVV